MTYRPLVARVPSRLPIDLHLTLGPLARGRYDPCLRVDSIEAWRAFHTPDGPATIRVRVDRRGREVEAEAWGSGKEWALEHARALAGLEDDPSALVTSDPLVRELQEQLPGLRLARTDAVYDVVVPVVLEQRVTGVEARRAWRNLVRRHGAPAPGPGRMWLAPQPSVVARLSDWERHRLGVESARGVTMSLVAGESGRLQRAAEAPAPALARRLRALPGVGPWTTAVVTHLVQGDPDAVPVGDYHICHEVTHAFTGEPRGSDERMLELLEPFHGQRGRVVRLVLAGMPARARTTPRARIPDRIRAEDAQLPRPRRARRATPAR